MTIKKKLLLLWIVVVVIFAMAARHVAAHLGFFVEHSSTLVLSILRL